MQQNFADKTRGYVDQVKCVMNKDIWSLDHVGNKTPKARLYHLLRVFTLTFQGLKRNKIPVQAAALTFYSLIGIGPLIALGIMVSGFVMDQAETDLSGQDVSTNNLAIKAISDAIAFAAPQVALPSEEGSDAPNALAPEMTEMINGFIQSAQSGTVGIVGSLMLFVIGIQVLTSIESSFNSLWGVAQGRKLSERIVVYWTVISLGAVCGAAALSLIALNAFDTFVGALPLGPILLWGFKILSPVFSFIFVTLFLATFFRFIPNTTVEWKPAFTGAALVVVLLHLYNLLSFLYVQRVVDTRSLYGSVGILVVLMLGLYIFWLLILLGGQLTYAMQNADFLTNESAWQRTSERTREVVSLCILLLIAKQFKEKKQPLRISEINEALRVPSHILNSSINRLCELGYIHPVESNSIDAERNRPYSVAIPLENITMRQFKQDFECYGNTEGADLLANHSPAIRTYLEDIAGLNGCVAADWSIGELMKQSTKS